MKITESEFRRLHFKSRALDRVCRILWPADGRNDIPSEMVRDAREAIGGYRPENPHQVVTYSMRIDLKD